MLHQVFNALFSINAFCKIAIVIEISLGFSSLYTLGALNYYKLIVVHI